MQPARARAADTRVISTAANGLLLVAVATWVLRGPLQLDALNMVRAAALFVAIMVLAIRYLPRYHPFPQFGAANQVTTVRAALVSVVASFVGEPETPIVAATAAGLASIATALDFVDGWLARRTGMSSAFGARFDLEVDALLILALSMLAWRHGKAGAWVVCSGLLRYLFVAAGWLAAWMRQPLPPSRRRQAVCVVQVAGLIAALAPAVEPPLSIWIAGGSLAALASSFLVDTLWLWRHAGAVGMPAHS